MKYLFMVLTLLLGVSIANADAGCKDFSGKWSIYRRIHSTCVDRDHGCRVEISFPSGFRVKQNACLNANLKVPATFYNFDLNVDNNTMSGQGNFLYRSYSMVVQATDNPDLIRVIYDEGTWVFGRFSSTGNYTAIYKRR